MPRVGPAAWAALERDYVDACKSLDLVLARIDEHLAASRTLSVEELREEDSAQDRVRRARARLWAADPREPTLGGPADYPAEDQLAAT